MERSLNSRYNNMRTSALLSIILLTSFSYGLNGTTSSPRLRNLHSSVVAGDWLYIDGGEVSYQKGVFTPENKTLAINLSTSWTNSSLNIISTDRPDGALPLNRQILWWDEKHQTIYCFGGEKSYGNPVGNSWETPPESIWKFTPDSNGNGSGNWTQAVGPASTHTFPSELVRVAGGISAHDDSNAYYLDGYVTAATSPKANFLHDAGLADIPGLLNFDFDSLELSNSTAGGGYASQYKSGNWLDIGAMLSAPKFGADGIFILIGGEENGLNNITIFDKHTQTWFTQTTTGAIPAPRTLFCAVAVQNNDTQSIEIFVHGGIQGGLGGPLNKDSDELYILSIPAFQWFQANYTSVSPRAGHTCHSAGNNQMILIGGSDPTQFIDNTMEAWNGTADPWTQGIGVFDMSNLVWKDSYNASAKPYTPPKIVKQYYDQNGSYPLTWSSPDVQVLFQPSLKNTTQPPPAVDPPRRHRLSSGSIAGLVVGCTTAVVLGAAAIIILIRRKTQSPINGDEDNEPENPRKRYKVSELTGSDTAVEMPTEYKPAELWDKGSAAEIDSMGRVVVGGRDFKGLGVEMDDKGQLVLGEKGSEKFPEGVVVKERFLAELPGTGFELAKREKEILG